MAPSASVDTLLLAGLQAETRALQEFKATLQAEQNALIGGDVAALTALSPSKLQQVENLNRLAAERLEHIAALGLSADRKGMEQWAAAAGTAADAAWRAMLAAAGAAHQANQMNGTLIQTRLQHNQQALTVLLAAANKANLYGPDGQPQGAAPGGQSRGIIGKA